MNNQAQAKQKTGFCEGAETNDPSKRSKGAELKKLHESQLSNKATTLKVLRQQICHQHAILVELRERANISDPVYLEIVERTRLGLNDEDDYVEEIFNSMIDASEKMNSV